MLVVNSTLVDRIVEIEIANLKDRLRPYARRSGNPSGVFFEDFGRATAFVAEHIPVRFYNSVLGMESATAVHLDEIEAFYERHGVSAAFEIVPGRLTEELGQQMAARGYAMVEFHAGLARELSAADASAFAAIARPPLVKIEVVDPSVPSALDLFLNTYLDGWGSSTSADGAKANMLGWKDNQSWTLYLARFDDEPAGAAILDVRQKTAMLGSASTRSSMRGRRVQSALLTRRVADAARAGCDLIVGGAYFGTTSMRNQQRAGLFTAFTRGIWARPATQSSG